MSTVPAVVSCRPGAGTRRRIGRVHRQAVLLDFLNRVEPGTAGPRAERVPSATEASRRPVEWMTPIAGAKCRNLHQVSAVGARSPRSSDERA